MKQHYDLLLESDQGVLITYELMQFPVRIQSPVAAKRLADHDPKYLVYEGPISQNRGQVRRVGEGTWSGELATEFQLRFDVGSAQHSGECWTLHFVHFEDADHSESLESTSADSSTVAGTLLSLKRLL